MICGSVRSGQFFAKVQNRTARKPYIEDKEGLEEGIPNFKRLGEGSLGLGKDYKTGFLRRRDRADFDRIPARSWPAAQERTSTAVL